MRVFVYLITVPICRQKQSKRRASIRVGFFSSLAVTSLTLTQSSIQKMANISLSSPVTGSPIFGERFFCERIFFIRCLKEANKFSTKKKTNKLGIQDVHVKTLIKLNQSLDAISHVTYMFHYY